MTPTDRPKFAQILTAMAETFDKEVTPGMSDLYWESLKDLSLEAFTLSAGKALRAAKWMPRPAEIRERAEGGKREDMALRAWDEVSEATSSVGAYRAVFFPDPVTAKTVRSMGGWPSLCRPGQEEHWLKKQFVEAWLSYDEIRHQLPTDVHMPGLIESKEPPKIVGHYYGQGEAPKLLADSTPDTIGAVLNKIKQDIQ